jgi:hypothetical protein
MHQQLIARGEMMEITTQEIAALLRSTDEMATQFVERVQARIGEPVSEADILAAMQKIPSKSLTMEKVVAKVQQKRKTSSRRTSRRQTGRSSGSAVEQAAAAGSASSSDTRISAEAAASAQAGSRKKPQTILEKLDSVLAGNWDRAEAEGLSPERVSAEAFVNAIYQHTDRREGTRQRILQAARQLDHGDVMLTPALVADTVHELFES